MKKKLKIEPTVFALKLDKGKMLGDPPPWALSKNSPIFLTMMMHLIIKEI